MLNLLLNMTMNKETFKILWHDIFEINNEKGLKLDKQHKLLLHDHLSPNDYLCP